MTNTNSEDEEKFIHHADCIETLNRAWTILQELNEGEHSPILHWAAYRFAIVEYAKPYTVSCGKNKRQHKLPRPQVSADQLLLHDQLVQLRHKVLAHTDISIKEARLYVHSFEGKPYAITSQNFVETLPLREEIIALIENCLKLMYVENDRLLDLRPISQ